MDRRIWQPRKSDLKPDEVIVEKCFFACGFVKDFQYMNGFNMMEFKNHKETSKMCLSNFDNFKEKQRSKI